MPRESFACARRSVWSEPRPWMAPPCRFPATERTPHAHIHRGRPERRPTRTAPQPVRRGSHRAGRCEAMFWRPTSRQEIRRVLPGCAALRSPGPQGRAQERPLGPRRPRDPGAPGPPGELPDRTAGALGRVPHGEAAPLQERHLRRAARAQGARLPGLAAAATSPRAERAGGPSCARPATPTASPCQPGPCGSSAASCRRRPCPTTSSTPMSSRPARWTAHRASLPLDELPLFEVEDDRLGQLLASLGRSVQERESASRQNPRLRSSSESGTPGAGVKDAEKRTERAVSAALARRGLVQGGAVCPHEGCVNVQPVS